MSRVSYGRTRGGTGSHGRWPGILVAMLVVGGLVGCTVGGLLLIAEPSSDLPGVALGSKEILVVERIAALLSAWLLALVVVARALAGELPSEVSGRGLRYADVETAQNGLADSERTLRRMGDEIESLTKSMVELQAIQDVHAGTLRRYAMRDEGHGH